MSAILYLIICFCTGYVICSFAIPNLNQLTKETYHGNSIRINRLLLNLPVYFLTGTILVTWTVYILAVVFQKNKQPLYVANFIAMGFYLIVSIGLAYLIRKRASQSKSSLIKEELSRLTLTDWIFLAVIVFLSVQLMYVTFHVTHHTLNVGYTVFSDFSPHIGMIRSFSKGNNFPTSYSHFAGEDIRYHFMYQFLVGNLEYLGLRIDWAMNLPSMIGMVSSFLLLFILAVKLSGKRAVGYLSCLFFAFRSSKTLFTFLAQVPKGTSIWKALDENNTFLGSTPNEDWGLWNLNVYCNQRHLAFTIPILLFVILLFIPTVYESITSLKDRLGEIKHNTGEPGTSVFLEKIKITFIHCFFTKESWKINNLPLAIYTGLLVGAIAFWNGAVTIATLLVLFIMAIVANRKLEYLITASISVVLSMIQSSAFIHGNVVDPKLEFGFIAENRTIFGVLDYIFRLTGILPFVLLAAFLVEKQSRKYLMVAFAAPFVFAFCVSLTIDVTVNHKYIMLSIMLLSIYAAILLQKMFAVKKFGVRLVAVVLVILLTATGIYDYTTVLRKNKQAIELDLDSELTKWISENCTSKDIILSSNYALNQVVLGGGMLFLGWPYYAWSAGYDTDLRAALVKEMFEASTKDELTSLIEQNNIRYIIVDKDCRDNVDYTVNEYNIAMTYLPVYSEGSGEWKITIYDTKKIRQD
ncbi:MAG: hypothetical protein PUC65_11015 [Clostridiales bacterium]|nr:hypothetical protein [Clostridiales bacterium]